MSYSKQRLKEVVALQKAVLDRIEAQLGRFGGATRLKYIREFNDEFQQYQAVCDFEEILAAAARTNLIWIGDYHALARSRSCAVEFLDRLTAHAGSDVALGVEVVFGRDQAILDRWMRGSITEQEFLERIDYHSTWGCDWSGYKVLFESARRLGIPVYGLDSPCRNDMRSIGRRDRNIARRVAGLLQESPARKIVALFGESHLASTHLPGRVAKLLGSAADNQLLVLQNIDSLYWRLQQQGAGGARAVRIRPQQYCLFNATPMEKYESFRQYLVRCVDDEEASTDWTCFVHTVIDAIVDFLEIEKHPEFPDGLPEVYSEMPAAQLAGFLVGQEISAATARSVVHHVQERGTSYIPELNSMFIDDFRLGYTTEEAVRFIHRLCRGNPRGARTSRQRHAPGDLFFFTIIERAFGYFFSKLLDSSRDGLESLSARVLQQIGYNEELTRTVTCLLDPGARPSAKHVERLRKTVEQTPGSSEMLQLLSQVLGYALGRRLYRAYLESRISRKEIQALLQDPLAAPHGPLECYVMLNARLS